MTTVLCGVLAVGGCSTTESGNAQPSTTTDVAATAALWDPCSEIPDSTLTSLGLDATSERSGILGADEPGWKVCRWEDDAYPSNYSVGAYATIHTIDDLRAKTENIEFKDIVVAGRSGVQFRQSNYDANEDCSYAFPTSSGFVQLDMLNAGVSAKLVPPCERLQPIAETIVPLFPK
ncbi:DUF3558 domain-containing protein [Nocardia mangyaensis]|uniref:DUF3558 domain-containing protein n=1 Tax=Nocardia mangyaensis TaxID=2213200 RepID=UPI0026761403|nr:DUF3558 domain-containing protein [Nocardia mangyaensis]MDO3648981.1 DUF3558 domain-containing protein [Nocardia mangyaensis]